MNANPHTNYAEVLKSARQLHDSQDFVEAEKAAVQAIGMMAATMSANNPKLAQAYRLHYQICVELSMIDMQHCRQWQEKAVVAAKLRLEVLEQGMLTAEVIEAKGILTALYFETENFAAALSTMESARDQIAELIERQDAGITVVDHLLCCHTTAEALIELSRESEAVSVLAGSFNRVRPEDYRDFKVMQVVSSVSMLLTALLGEQDSADAQQHEAGSQG